MDKIFIILYSLFALLLNLLLVPLLYILSLVKSKYKSSIPFRFFPFFNKALDTDGVWFHSCSFGEARAIYPLMDMLPIELLRLSATTQTGYDAVKIKAPKQSRYLPFEPWLWVWIRPQKVLVVMEAELWLLMFAIAKQKGAKTILINARISDKSLSSYKRMSFLYRQIFKYIDEVYAQTETDKSRLEMLGAKCVKVTGNIKLSTLPKANKSLPKHGTPTICGASTHSTEESLLLEAFVKLKHSEPKAQIILAPRHPERFAEVIDLVDKFSKKHNMSFATYSKSGIGKVDIVILDLLGELVNIYNISDVVIMGGTFVPVGGHNVAEAAQFGCKVISGKTYYNQRDVYSAIDGISIVGTEELTEVLLMHSQLPNTTIKHKTNINPIMDSINKSIKER